MSEHHAEIIIIKKKIVRGGAHHGGAWKIAFADFMTAMMAFFLVLWIINATDKDTRTVIARYFNPVKLENSARATKGVHGVDSTKIISNEAKGDQAPDTEPGGEASSGKTDRAVGPAAAPPEGAPSKKDTKPKTPSAVPHPDPRDSMDVRPTMSETALFSDPYKALDKIAGGRSSDSPAPGPDTGDDGPARAAGANSLEAFRDPFKPIGPGAQTDSVSLDADAPPSPLPDQRADLVPQKGQMSMSAPTGVAEVETTVPPNETAPPATPVAPGGKDGADTPTHSSADPSSTGQSHAPTSGKEADLMKELQRQLGPLEKSEKGPAIEIEATKEGLLISLTDRLNFSMFAVGSAEPRPEVIKAMETIAGIIKPHAEQLVVRGHTDGRPYKTALYDNWRLSSARAQMAYYMLTRAGVPEAQFQRIEGHADHALRDPAHPLAAENRRVEILIREVKP